jgi:hypothetical protein
VKRKQLLLSISAAGLMALASPHATADWSGFVDIFKSEGSKVLESGTLSKAADAAGLSQEQIANGLKEALAKGTQTAVQKLGKPDGFLKNLDVKIPMPKHLSMVEKGLRAIGQDAKADQFVEGMNRAAERAVPEAAAVFGDAIRKMSIDDAKGLLNGSDQAATEYLKRSSGDSLKTRMRPIIDSAIGQVGMTKKYQDMVDKAGFASKFIDTEKLDLGNYVTEKTMDGVFLMVGEQERLIRENPAARTTDLLKKVFMK